MRIGNCNIEKVSLPNGETELDEGNVNVGVGKILEEENISSELDDDIIRGGTVLDGVGESGELVCKVDEEDITSKLDDAIIEGDDERTVLDGVGESGELVCKLENEDIIFELDDDFIVDDDDNDKDDTRELVITEVVVVLSNIHSLGRFGSLLGI